MKKNRDLMFGIVLLGLTGVLIGVVTHSMWLSLVAGLLGVVVGGFLGWLGGRRYLITVCVGILIGAYFGYKSDDKDILIIAAGSGGAIGGFIGAQLELFMKRR